MKVAKRSNRSEWWFGDLASQLSWSDFCKFKVIFSAFYNISQPNFAILLILVTIKAIA
jgi:hypothetical protein